MKDSRKRLMERLDCTREFGPDRYFHYGDVKVVEGPAGRYRQAEAMPLSRFGYRFQIQELGQPHQLVIRYPDDRRRFMIVNDGTSYDLSTGVITGHTWPVSNEMKRIDLVFWPRWKDCCITFMTWGHGEPAAVESIEVYRLAGLPELAFSSSVDLPHRRELGIQYEDPGGMCADEGALTFEQWLDRMVTYARHTGQKLLAYPICWYHGPLFPSETQPSDCFSTTVAPDRRFYTAWTLDPPDWPAVLLERFGREGLEFQGVLTLLRLGNLLKNMNIDLEAIKGGAETYNNMLWNDCVQEGTLDWTVTYNARNFPALVADYERTRSDDFNRAYGEKVRRQCTGEYHPGPMFNPLHPTVQEAVIGFIREIGRRYGGYPAFKGVSIQMWIPTIIWFGSIHSGYDDYTVGLFQQETGIEAPVEGDDPNRFSKRYEFLTFIARPAWIEWRCRKIHELICRMRDAMVEARPDLRITLNLWSETSSILIGQGRPQQQLYARLGAEGLAREAGLDLSLYVNEPNIEIDIQLEGGGRDRTPSGESENASFESFYGFRDHDYLHQETLNAVHAQTRPGAFIFNAWHEAWGKFRWFPCNPNDPQAEQFARAFGKQVGRDHVFHMNSTYPEDGFWWDWQWRITHAFPPEMHFMEPYAHAVAELDACRITRGGLFLDKANGERISAFARAYRVLPDEKFETVGPTTDPVAVRTLVRDGRRYLYAVNREYYPVVVEIRFDRMPAVLTDLASDERLAPSQILNIELGPYELRSLGVNENTGITGFRAMPPEDISGTLMAEGRRALQALEKVKRSKRFIAGLARMAERIRDAVETGKPAFLRRALSSYIVRKCEQLLDKEGRL